MTNEQQRFTPEVSVMDGNIADYFKSIGYKSVSVPPGMPVNVNGIQQGQQAQQPQLQQPNGPQAMLQNLQQTGQQQNAPVVPYGAPPQITPSSSNQNIESGTSLNFSTLQAPQQVQGQFQVQKPQPHGSRHSDFAFVNQQQQPQAEFIVGPDGNFHQVQTQNTQQQFQQPAQQQIQAPVMQQQFQAPQQQDQQQFNVQNQQPVINGNNDQGGIERQIAELKMANEQMKAFIINQSSQQSAQGQPQPSPGGGTRPPNIADFKAKVGDKWDNNDLLDPSTSTGKAYADFMDARDEYNRKQVFEQVNRSSLESSTNQKMAALAAQNPELQDVFGKPDVNKIKLFFNEILNGDWNSVYNAVKGKGKQNQQQAASQNFQPVNYQQPQNFVNAVPQIQNVAQPAQFANGYGYGNNLTTNTNTAQPVVEQQIQGMANNAPIIPISNGSSGVMSGSFQQPQMPSAVTELQRYFGNNFSIPANAIVR